MKKTYMIPQVLIVHVAQTLPLMGSAGLQYDGENYTGELGTTNATSEGLSKSYSVWSNDWNEE